MMTEPDQTDSPSLAEQPSPAADSGSLTSTSRRSRLHFGAAYYPEHWSEDRWQEDIQLMREASFSVVRLAEFAWSRLEPSDGEFDFDWLERAIQLLAENGIVTVLGTPSAAPPAWLTSTHPETLAVDEYGRRAQHGNRCHYCVNSPVYHHYVHRIVHAMAEWFGPDPNVIGWQTDNEFNRVCYCEICRGKFHAYLTERYESLDILNQRWSTAYWSQTYSSWDQIPIPIGGHNPGLMLEFKRFTTRSYRDFQKMQLDELRPFLPDGVWVTHNFMGWFAGLDYYDIAADLDIASWDDYVGSGHHDYLNHSAVHSLTRGFKQKNYWVMETQPGSVNWSKINNVLDKGEARVMAWQGVAHGMDGLLYWQWRSALGGQEQYHGTLIDQSGQPRPFYEEARQIGEEFSKVSDLLADSYIPQARVAMINDYDSRWAVEMQPHHAEFDYVRHFNHYYRCFALRNIPVDVLSAKSLESTNSLKGYKVVIAPALNVLTRKQSDCLVDFVRRGNHLVLTLRTGMKDEYNALLPMRQPGYLVEVSGMEVEEFYALDGPVPIKGSLFEGHADLWAEKLKLTGKFILPMGKYQESNGWLDGSAAITVTGVSGGMGLTYYVGAYLDDVSQQIFVDRLILNAHLVAIKTPAEIEVRIRKKPVGTKDESNALPIAKEEEIYFVINHAPHPSTIWLPWLAFDHLTDQVIDAELNLPPYGVAVLTKIDSEGET
jgi:beta-galactosidase